MNSSTFGPCISNMLSNANHLLQIQEPAEEEVNVPGDGSCFPYGQDRQQPLEAEACSSFLTKSPALKNEVLRETTSSPYTL